VKDAMKGMNTWGIIIEGMSFFRIHCCIYEFIKMISLWTNNVCYRKIAKTEMMNGIGA
jgi:hypothetical protein